MSIKAIGLKVSAKERKAVRRLGHSSCWLEALMVKPNTTGFFDCVFKDISLDSPVIGAKEAIFTTLILKLPLSEFFRLPLNKAAFKLGQVFMNRSKLPCKLRIDR